MKIPKQVVIDILEKELSLKYNKMIKVELYNQWSYSLDGDTNYDSIKIYTPEIKPVKTSIQIGV